MIKFRFILRFCTCLRAAGQLNDPSYLRQMRAAQKDILK